MLCQRETMKIKLRTGVVDFEERTVTNNYGVGLGIVDEEVHEDDGNIGTFKNLVYFKKGTEECGIPNNITSTIEIADIDVIEVVPNPCTHELDIITDNLEDAQLTVFDLNGRIKFSDMVKRNNKELNVAEYSPGLYFINIRIKGELFSTKFVKM